jgi:hypothetical protein
MTETPTRVESWLRWLKNHKVISIVILIGSIVIYLGSFTDAISKICNVVWPDKPFHPDPPTPVPVPEKSWHRFDESGLLYTKVFKHTSENRHDMPSKTTQGIYELGLDNARIYEVRFEHSGGGAPWNYHTSKARPNDHDGDTEIINDGKSFRWRRRWAGGPTDEIYTAYFEMWR